MWTIKTSKATAINPSSTSPYPILEIYKKKKISNPLQLAVSGLHPVPLRKELLPLLRELPIARLQKNMGAAV